MTPRTYLDEGLLTGTIRQLRHRSRCYPRGRFGTGNSPRSLRPYSFRTVSSESTSCHGWVSTGKNPKTGEHLPQVLIGKRQGRMDTVIADNAHHLCIGVIADEAQNGGSTAAFKVISMARSTVDVIRFYFRRRELLRRSSERYNATRKQQTW